MGKTIVSGGFDNINSSEIRFIHEASKTGSLVAKLWSDDAVEMITGKPPRFPLTERKYYLDAIRFIDSVEIADNALPADMDIDTWITTEKDRSDETASFCETQGINYKVLSEDQLSGFPPLDKLETSTSLENKKVVVTGCYDWFHTGHVRFFEEVSQLGDLHVCIGNDANIEFLKGEGHPLFREAERRYMVQAIRFVTKVHINSGTGWMDAEPEIRLIKPDIYAVNEDGHKPEKQEYCQANGIEYVVLKRTPAPGLEKRESTALRGF